MAAVVNPEVARNKYLLKKYAITTAEYNARFADQGGKCKICGREPKEGGRGLHVDHSHKIAGQKIKARMVVAGEWVAWIPDWPTPTVFNGISRDVVKAEAKRWLLRKSIRGLICWLCNAGLKDFFDNSTALRSAGAYLDTFISQLYTE